MKLENKVALITGASRGIGRATALLFAEEGAKVIVNYFTQEERADEVVVEIKSKRRNAIAIRCDVSQEKQVKEMVDRVIEEYGKIDILVNNAGICYEASFLEKPLIQWERTIAVNLYGPVLCSKYVIPHMLEQGSGAIINISSTNGIDSLNPQEMDYDASKAALINLTQNLARKFVPIRINCIAPGWIDTDMNRGFSDEFIRTELEKIYLRRFGTPSDVAKAAVFLASDDASFITGSVLKVDGGYD